MKRFTFILSLFFAVIVTAMAQSPNKINYQATIRDNSGHLLISKSVSMRISILQSGPTGIAVYSENHLVTTTAQGIINLQIGSGTTSDDLSAISWNDGPYFLKVEVDSEGGDDFISIGTSEMVSVPFAMSANSAGKVNWPDVQNKPDLATVSSTGSYNDLSDKPVPSPWNISGNKIYYNIGNVGIGIDNPSTKLHIVTTSSDDENESRNLVLLRNLSSSNKAYTCLNLRADDDAYGLGISFTSSNYNLIPDFQRSASIGTNGKALALSVTSSDGSIRFLTNPNQTGLEEKMRMDTQGNIGIGTNNPLRKLHIETTSVDNDNESRDLLLLRNLSASSRAYTCLNLRADDNAYGLGISFTSSNYSLIDDFQSSASIGTNGKALALSVTSSDGSIRFLTNPYQTGLIEMMRLDTQGNVGIGTTSPHSKLEIAGGDVYIKDISSGIIMTSPDGQCWRGTINNFGILEFSSISCP